MNTVRRRTYRRYGILAELTGCAIQLYRKNGALYGSEYEISGTTGVVIHYIAGKGLAPGITGVDVFSYVVR